MAKITYRDTLSPTIPVSDTVKGTPLTNLEMDGNFKSISDAVTNLDTLTTLVSDNATAAEMYLVWVAALGATQFTVSDSKLRYNPNTDTLTAAQFAGNATTVTTNANLTGMVTSSGNATTVVTNANLSGMVTSSGNTTTVVTNANLTGMVTSSGNATTVVTNANLTGMVTSSGNATTVVTNANLTGEVTSTGNATTVTNSAVIDKVLTGYTKGAGTVAATDSILAAIQKLDANNETNANLTGEVTSTGNATTVTNAAVIAKLLTGYTKGAGTVAATDSILAALQKLDANADLKAPLASPALTGTPSSTTAAVDTNTTQVATTAFVLSQAAAATPLSDALVAAVGTSTRYARADHVHPDAQPRTFRAYRGTTNQVITSAQPPIAVVYNTKSWDTPGTSFNTTTGQWTPAEVGYYSIRGDVYLTGTNITTVTLQIVVNTTIVSEKIQAGFTVSTYEMSVSDMIRIDNVADTVEIRVSATGTGAAPEVLFGSEHSRFSGVLEHKG